MFLSHIDKLSRVGHVEASIKRRWSTKGKNCLKLMSKENKASGESRSQR